MTYSEAIVKLSSLKKGENLRKEAIELIGEELYEDLSTLGLISEGVAVVEEEPEDVFAITSMGEKQVKFASTKPSKEELEIGAYLTAQGGW